MKPDEILALEENEDLALLYKPANIHTTSRSPSDSMEGTVAGYIHSKLQNIESDLKDAGLINRLDYETSGILIAAKSKESFEYLSELQNQKLIKKGYLALVEGEFNTTERVQNYIGSQYRRSKKVQVYSSHVKRTLPAETLFSPVENYPNKNVSLIKAKLSQGRRHQIRAHAASIGHPLVGDELYGSSKSAKGYLKEKYPAPFLLVANTIEINNQRIKFSYELPDEYCIDLVGIC